jgi:hypothetical protein
MQAACQMLRDFDMGQVIAGAEDAGKKAMANVGGRRDSQGPPFRVKAPRRSGGCISSPDNPGAGRPGNE